MAGSACQSRIRGGTEKGSQNALGYGVPKGDYLGQTGGLQRHLFEKAGGIYNACDKNIAHCGEFFLDSGTWIKRAVSDGDVPQVLFGAKGGIHSD